VERTQDYDDKLVKVLQALWGDMYLSPGGNDETALVLEGLDLRGLRVLDLGCGVGGCALFLAEQCGPVEVVGVDVDAFVVGEASANAAAAGLSDRVQFLAIEPGPLPFADGEFDVVFSKDSIIHVPDKHAIAAEIFRVLVPGGLFIASDWMASSDAPPSPTMLHYLATEGLDFRMAPPETYFDALRAAGFERISFRNRTPVIHERSHRELADLGGRLRPGLEASVGRDFLEHEIEVWRTMCAVFDAGEITAGHWRAQKP
jgi:phosphoethanolamine N-methyltransferase